ncbi:inhibitor of growth protein 2 [Drosophila elegans]|uniref:inhibitor of growth protein 2 n=1 Tax=Drosophila elegans TaxID=30023 RepID=UPI0007E62283|nr:inhibitor of growth protein 2 [Drosophila elegans]
MINPIASESEAINSANYVDNYIDSVENLPDDVQRQLSRIRDIDVQYRGLIRDVDHYYDLYLSLQNSPDAARRSRSMTRMHQSLIQAQELGDEKMQIVNHMQEIIDGKLRQLDTDQQNLDLKEERDRYATLLEDGQPSKLQRLQSPMREQGNLAGTGNSGLNGNGLLSAKDHYVLGGYPGGVVPGSSAMPSGNGGSSTPNSERSSHVSNGGNSGSNGNVSGGAGGDLQRTGSKRSRRRNESLVNNGSSLEMGGNESNSANEASGSGGGGSGERKSSLGGGNGAGLGRKASLQAAASSLASGSAATSSGAAGGGGASGSGAGVVGGGNNSGKKKKRKVRGSGASNANASTREETPPPETIDPDEPTYCVCNQISFGEMILCDNDLCPIEWFHFSCVSLVLKPKGKWFCPNCRGERPNVMKPKAQFLKELERYNKEKEEKT